MPAAKRMGMPISGSVRGSGKLFASVSKRPLSIA
jgi:hypothetical protein